MIITFCGHSDFYGTNEYEKQILDFLEKRVGDKPADMYLGGYGGFDNFAYDCCKKYKEAYLNVSLVFVTPYLTPEYQKNHLKYLQKRYDSIIFPDIENKPPRFAIYYRNRYIISKADLVIAFVKYKWGGAYTAYKYAKKLGKEIFNLAEFE